MPNALILYATSHGHTATVAGAVAEAMSADGLTTDVRDVADANAVALTSYDVVVVGGSIHAGRHQRAIAEWVRAHATTLNAMPSAFFSLSLTAAEETPEATMTTRRLVDELLDETGWTPARTATFAGALQYRAYGLPTRLLVRTLMKRGGHPTDTSRDYDYTDWDAVRDFGRSCAAMLAPAAAGAR